MNNLLVQPTGNKKPLESYPFESHLNEPFQKIYVAQCIFIDESGDLGQNGSKYLVLAALLLEEPKALERIIKNMRRNKFRKELRNANEIKADKSSKEVILHMLLKLNKVAGAKICFIVLEKRKLHSNYLKNDKHELYNYVAGKLARNLSLGESRTKIRVDKSTGVSLQRNFNRNFLKNLRGSPEKISIEHSYSYSWHGLQFADVLAWACFQKFEHNNSEYIDLINLEKEIIYVW